MGSRDQARRLPTDGPKGRQPGQALHPAGLRWSGKYPRIVEALLSLRVQSIIVDGEAVWAGKDGKSDFDRLHSNAHDDAVFLYAFDLLELNGEDYGQHPLEQRKGKLEKNSCADRGDAVLRAHRRRWRDDIRACLQNGFRRHRVEAAGFPAGDIAGQLRGKRPMLQDERARVA